MTSRCVRTQLDAAIQARAQPGRTPLLLANALLDRADLVGPGDRVAATAERAGACIAAAAGPGLPPSIARRLSEH
jgi:hypothetical protein